MKWIKKCSIDDVCSQLFIDDSYLIYYTKKNQLMVKSISTLDEMFQLGFDRDYSFSVNSDDIYITCDNNLYIYSLLTGEERNKINTDLQYLVYASKDVFLASSFFRKARCYETKAILENGLKLWEIKGSESYRVIFDDGILFSNRAGTRISLINTITGEVFFEASLSQNITGNSILSDNKLYLVLENSLVCYDLKDKSLLWDSDINSRHYFVDEYLFGVSANQFEAFDIDTGEMYLQKKYDENLNIIDHLTTYVDGCLYFSGFKDNNVPVFGGIEVKTRKLAFMQEVEMPGENSFRRGLDKPVVIGNRLFLRDSDNVLHIFERNE